ncbi:unnamed protein product [Bemisia tabaci]|uniref:Uncharacterized protein n=1 Tax=Bemisia tabaci TaxID=7038 RepID=A0A9P0A5J3_BEMTA|nr:PREDICTED: uncharacterized protein LOC109042795 isoform X2 [Bemisia tabaci]CAH0384369.1 unnamed protein product [Bemisia tabaci]
MVYESDFYTTRRPYTRPSPTISSYSITRRYEVPWEKVPFVPRPSQVPLPYTVYGRRSPTVTRTTRIIRVPSYTPVEMYSFPVTVSTYRRYY